MATFDITVPAQSNQSGTSFGSDAFTEPGDFDGATVDDVSVVGTPTITSDSQTDDTIGVRFFIAESGGANTWGGTGSDAASLCSASIGDFVASDTIVDGSATSPQDTPAVAADWDVISFSCNYAANMMADDERISWSEFTIRVTYTPSGGASLTADPGSLVLTGALVALTATFSLTGDPGSLVLTGAEADLNATFGGTLQADPGSLVLTGAEADLLADQNFLLTGDPGSLVLTGAAAMLTPSIGGDPGSLLFTGAEADLIATGAPALVVRRGGVRWLREPDPEKRAAKVKQLVDLVKPTKTPKSASTGPQEPEKTQVQMIADVTSRLTAGQQTRVERLLEQTGISLDELLILLS